MLYTAIILLYSSHAPPMPSKDLSRVCKPLRGFVITTAWRILPLLVVFRVKLTLTPILWLISLLMISMPLLVFSMIVSFLNSLFLRSARAFFSHTLYTPGNINGCQSQRKCAKTACIKLSVRFSVFLEYITISFAVVIFKKG